jgi:NAD+ synthase
MVPRQGLAGRVDLVTAPAATDPLALDLEATVNALASGIRDAVRELGRRGAVLGVSGGVDSGVCAALAVRAFGPKHVLLLRMPEKDIGQGASDLGLELAESLGAPQREESISAALEGLGCYRRRDEAIREVFPAYESHWKHKVVRSAPGGVVVFALVIEKPDGSREEQRIPAATYRKLIAATNMKQRVRKLIEYTWADALGYAVIGTPNRLEYDQGFFVKGGDGLADIKPIAKLYKTQVYALARQLGLPPAIAERDPTTETFSLPQTQEEFYFGHPYDRMDLLVHGVEEDISPADLAPLLGMDAESVASAYDEVRRVRKATSYLHSSARIIDIDGSNHPAGR